MLILTFLFAALSLTSSAPVLPSTTDVPTTSPLAIFGRELPDCVNVARYRTVQDIVLSCAATIFACAWVAVHSNVPDPNDSGWLRLKQRILTMIYAILAPEFIVMWALRQRIGAVKHMKEYNEKFHGSVAPPSRSIWWYIRRWFCGSKEKSDEYWTITHGFLVEMRGLVDKNGNVVEHVTSRNYWRQVDISEALNIPEDDISDKSKGDFLTKLFVLLQTMWFMFQCLARWTIHLPVTELEVVTLAFALLNIGTYTLWWSKPQNMVVAIRMDRYQKPKIGQEEGGIARGSGEEVATRNSPAPSWRASLEEEQENREAATPTTFSDNDKETFSEEEERSLDERRSSSGCGGTQNTEEDHHLLGSKPSLEDPPNQRSPFVVKITAIVGRCILSLGALVAGVAASFDPRRLQSLDFGDIWEFFLAPFWPLLTITMGDNDDVGTLFGGLHLVPIWSSSFPSSSEELLWQISAGIITIAPSITAFLTFFAEKAGSLLLGFSDMIVFGSYLVARAILIALAFTTLRDLPPDAFQNIAWTTFIPHF